MPKLSPSLFAALAVIVASVTIIVWRRSARSLRFAVSTQLVLFTIGAALITGKLAQSQSPIVVMLAGVAFAGIISVMSRAGEVGRVRRMVGLLASPEDRERARHFLVRWASAARPSQDNAAALRWYAPLVCSAAGAMIAHDLTDDACELLRAVPAELPEPRTAAARTTLLAMAHLSRGRHDEAAAALRAAPSDVDHTPSRHMLAAAKALLYALQGYADDALGAVRPFASEPQLHGLVLAVEAHARAQRGELELAKAALGQLRDAGGDQALERIVAHDGPASQLAASFQ
jgi:hypothetical protein